MSDRLGRDVIRKIITDAVACRDNSTVFRKSIWGGTADATGAVREMRPDRPRRYAVISGEVDVADRARLQDIHNSVENQHGGVIDLMLLSSTGAEGLDLWNGRHVHVMEPYWNWGRVDQIKARYVRNDSHKALPAAEKNVATYIYLAVPPETERLPNGEFEPTTDIELYTESVTNQLTIESFLEAVSEVCIECMVNAESNCRSCNPTDQKLFTDDIYRDIRTPDPCHSVREEHVRAQEIMVNDVKYYYTADADSIFDYKVFTFDSDINAYRPMIESDPLYGTIVDAITAGPPPEAESVGPPENDAIDAIDATETA